MLFGPYAQAWLDGRRRVDGRPLAPKTAQTYGDLLRRYLLPTFGATKLTGIRTEQVRAWHGQVAAASGPAQAAKAYRLLRVILNTAVEDERLALNPCKVRGAGVERAPERPFIDADVVIGLADAIEPRLRALVLLAGFGGLRRGELLGLRRRDVDCLHASVTVCVQVVELDGVKRITTAPKTDAGVRTVALPAVVVEALDHQLATWSQPGPDGLVFTGAEGGPLPLTGLYRSWRAACASCGLVGVHLHDLRHAAGTLAAQTGATTRELMGRLGHASPAAAMRYQHAAARRDAEIAGGLDAMVAAVAARPAATVASIAT